MGQGRTIAASAAAIFVGAMLFSPSVALATRVVVLKSGNLLPVLKVVAVAKKQLNESTTVVELNLDRLNDAELAEALDRANPEAMIALGPVAAGVAAKVRPQTPVVYALVPNAAAAGLNPARATGVAMLPSPQRYVEFTRHALPKARRIGVIYSPEYFDGYIKQARAHADKLGLSLKAEAVSSEREVAAAARKLIEEVDALWLLPDPNVATRNSFKFIVQVVSEERHIPILAYTSELFTLGALLALAPDLNDIGQRLADITLRVLSGTKPADIAVAVPEGHPEFNLKLAEAMGLSDIGLWTQLQAHALPKE